MTIVFIYNGAEHLGIEYISSFLKSKGHQVHLLFDPAVFSGEISINSKLLSRVFNLDDDIIKKTIELKPDIVAFSAYTGNYRWCLKIAQAIKRQLKVPIVFGGVHTTAVPERVLSNDFIDFAIIGEGEHAMFDLVCSLEKGFTTDERLNIPNICYKCRGDIRINEIRPYIKDLDSLPFPDKLLFYDKTLLFEELYIIMTSRGCPYDCTYCSNNMYNRVYCKERQSVRRRSPGNVIEELIYTKKRKIAKSIGFLDDIFTLSKPWLEEFMEEYKTKINLPFFCHVSPLTVTKEIASLLKEGGCWRITVGVQSGSERIRNEVFNRKGSNTKIIEVVSYIKDMGIDVSVDNIFGAPSETEDDLKQGLDLYNKVKADRILTFWLTFYPRTEIVNHAKKENILSDKDIENIEEGYVGYTNATGSVDKDKMAMYAKYELLFQLRSFISNDRLYFVLSKIASIVPFKKMMSMAVIVLNGIKNKDKRFFYILKYIWTKKNVP